MEDQLFNDFFDPFLGSEDFVLTDQGRFLAKRVYSLASREIFQGESPDLCFPSAINVPFSEKGKIKRTHDDPSTRALKLELRRILDLFQKVRDARDEFIDHFYGWSFLRFKSIKEMKQLTTSLDYTLYNCDLFDFFKGALNLAGGGMVLGALLFPFHLSIMPAIGGGLAGGVVTGAASILIWRCLSYFGIITRPLLKMSCALLHKEHRSLMCMDNWFKYSNHLSKSVEALVGPEVVKTMFEDWKMTLIHQRTLHSDVWAIPILSQCIRNVYACGIRSKFGSLLAPVVVTYLFIIFLFHEQNRLLFDCISKIYTLNYTPLFEVENVIKKVSLMTLHTKATPCGGNNAWIDSDLSEIIETLSNQHRILEQVRVLLLEVIPGEETYNSVSKFEVKQKTLTDHQVLKNSLKPPERMTEIANMKRNIFDNQTIKRNKTLLSTCYEKDISEIMMKINKVNSYLVEQENLPVVKKKSANRNSCSVTHEAGLSGREEGIFLESKTNPACDATNQLSTDAIKRMIVAEKLDDNELKSNTNFLRVKKQINLCVNDRCVKTNLCPDEEQKTSDHSKDDIKFGSCNSEERQISNAQEKNNNSKSNHIEENKGSEAKEDRSCEFTNSSYKYKENIFAIIVLCVPVEVGKHEVLNGLKEMIPNGETENIKFHRLLGKKVCNHWVFEGNPGVLRQLVGKGKLHIKQRFCRIREFYKIFLCHNCQFFCHNYVGCKINTFCGYCAGNHDSSHCDMKEICCVNCKRYNAVEDAKYDTKHSVYGPKCPTYCNLLQHLKQHKSLKSWLKKVKQNSSLF